MKKINGTLLPEKEDFYSRLNITDITDADYSYAKRVCKNFKIKKLEEYHDLYVQSDVFENFRNCLEIYEIDLVKCLSASGLKW